MSDVYTMVSVCVIVKSPTDPHVSHPSVTTHAAICRGAGLPMRARVCRQRAHRLAPKLPRGVEPYGQ